MTPTREQLEYAISQYIDGILPPLESAALEERLARDPEAQLILAEYQALDHAVKTSLRAVPAVAWDRFASHLSDAVAREQPPVTTYVLFTWRRAAGVALAACLAIVATVAFVLNRAGDEAQPTQIVAKQDPSETTEPLVIVVGPQPESAPDSRAAVAQVSIGPAPTMSDSWRYAETVVSRPAVVLIDRASRPAQDTDASPF